MLDLDLEEIVRRSGPLRSEGAVVYFLIDAGETVYIGQSKKILGRLYEHSMRKKFDSYYILSVADVGDLDDVERFYINKFRPKHNSMFLPVSPDFLAKAAGEKKIAA
ncbi:GIY-YIG nuclease family protein [Paraburkholderia sp. Ac-20342]|uniref:GIY-YIG nuclease family protein n=1 Tax=Paraburkholderia sp. Ac-20342 TaxID=2703889 RepID=UPI00197DFFC2|nr:GIY-YIG nuclease family protein [Paraburkholderia sp. Ac-20342]MBN3848607.1 GIY-YIG nuclease family protein [Paraburkholderia sp. Ac-20342]